MRAHATRQIAHPGSPSQSKYSIVLLQEYINIAAFDIHCAANYVTDFFKTYVESKDTAIKGYGRAMQEYRLKRARELGYHVAVLQASNEGYPLYQQLGYKEYGHFREYKN